MKKVCYLVVLSLVMFALLDIIGGCGLIGKESPDIGGFDIVKLLQIAAGLLADDAGANREALAQLGQELIKAGIDITHPTEQTIQALTLVIEALQALNQQQQGMVIRDLNPLVAELLRQYRASEADDANRGD